ncbi:10403_t:CDS:1, partial [Dentiscutata heterogama]
MQVNTTEHVSQDNKAPEEKHMNQKNNVNKKVHINHMMDTHLDNYANQLDDRQDKINKSPP